jgi:hypothetical protein
MKANPITSRVKDKFKSLVQEPLLNVGKVEGGKSDCGCGAKSPAKQTASQTATFGPDGTDPNPKLFAGIVKNAKKAPAKKTNKKVLKAAKRGAKAKAKSEFKYAQANAKFDKAEGNISRKEARARIRNSRQDFRDAKKEIKDYVDY